MRPAAENKSLVLCLQTKSVVEIERRVGSLELIASRAVIVFKYQVGRTMTSPDKRGEGKAIPDGLKKDIRKHATSVFFSVMCVVGISLKVRKDISVQDLNL